MSSSVPAFLLAWAGRSGPAKVLRQARSRLEQRRLGSRAELAVELTAAERRQVEQVLTAGWAQSGGPVLVRELRRGLESNSCTLEALLIAVGGPLRDLPTERSARRQALSQAQTEAVAQLRGLLGVPLRAAWLEPIDAALLQWVVRRRPPRERADDVAAVVAALPPAWDAVLLAVLAAQATGDAHALDRNRPLGRAVARFLALRAVVGQAGPDDDATGLLAGWSDPAGTAEGWRGAWASAGVACDTVSSQVLVLNLPLAGDAPAVAVSRAVPGEPVWLTLRSLTGTLSLSAPRDVHVCENPSIIESAADRLGARSAPLVCTFGRPSLAAIRLLEAIASTARLHLRADGDAVGWTIVNGLAARFPQADRWRMPDGSSLFEEQLIDDLLDDLDHGGHVA